MSDKINHANEQLATAKSVLVDLYAKRKGLLADKQRVEIKAKYGDVNATSELDAIMNVIVDTEVELEEAKEHAASLQHELDKVRHAEIELEIQQYAQSIHIDLGVNIEEQPVFAARLVSSMAGTIQYSLESGKPYFVRLAQRLYSRQFGSDNEGGPMSEQPSDFSYDVEEEYKRLEDERRMQKAYLYAFKSMYDKAYAARDVNASWFPKFLNRTNQQVASQIAEREEKRHQKFLEEQKALKSEVAKFTNSVESLPEFDLPF